MSDWTIEQLFVAETRLRCAASKYASTQGMHVSEDRKELRDAAMSYARIAGLIERAMRQQA